VYDLGSWKHPEGKDIQPGFACIMDINDLTLKGNEKAD
jgi:hypothetical protein